METPVLLIFQEDFDQRGFPDWLKSHLTGSPPPHRYAGNLEVTPEALVFRGTDREENVHTVFTIPRDTIEEVYYGFDSVYSILQTRGLGLFWSPVRLKFTDRDDRLKTVYLVTGYTLWKTTNREFFRFLKDWLGLI